MGFIKTSTALRWQTKYYNEFANSQARGLPRRERPIFQNDYQTYLWAFILGISEKVRTKLEGSTSVAFKWETIESRSEIANKMTALVISEIYSQNMNSLKDDFISGQLSENIRLAIEEFANTGFKMIAEKKLTNPSVLSDPNEIINSIIGDENSD